MLTKFMKAKTYMFTDWIQVNGPDFRYLAKVFATQDEAYMIVKVRNQTKFFRVDKRLLILGEMGFFENVMESAKELPIKSAIKIGFN